MTGHVRPFYTCSTLDLYRGVITRYRDSSAIWSSQDEWTIPLADLGGINTSRIDSITVGIGGTGVQGKVFVDAIRTAQPYPAPASTE